MSDYPAFVTQIGLAANINGYITGNMLSLTELAVGSSDRSIDGSEEALGQEVWRGPINRLARLGDSNQFVIEAVIPADVGPFTIHEAAAFDADGQMIAIARLARTDKVPSTSGLITEISVSIVVAFEHASIVELKIDPTTVIASRAHVEDRAVESDLIGHLALLTANTNRLAIATLEQRTQS